MSLRTLSVVCLLFATLISAQVANTRFDGKVFTQGSPEDLWVELYDQPGHFLADRQPVSRDGSFSVSVVHSRTYEVRVLSSRGDRLLTESVQLRQGQPIELRLATGPVTAQAVPGGPISAARLGHKPVKAARRLMSESISLAESGNLPGSLDRLERAVKADPKWFEAWNNLGSKQILLGKYAEAEFSFTHALEIDSNSSLVLSNLGLTYLFLQRPADAESAAARALQLDPGSSRGSYVMALALLQMNKRTADAISSLTTAAQEMPRARLALAEWHCRHSEFQACSSELKTFLKTPEGPNHANARRWVVEVDKVLQKQRNGD